MERSFRLGVAVRLQSSRVCCRRAVVNSTACLDRLPSGPCVTCRPCSLKPLPLQSWSGPAPTTPTLRCISATASWWLPTHAPVDRGCAAATAEGDGQCIGLAPLVPPLAANACRVEWGICHAAAGSLPPSLS